MSKLDNLPTNQFLLSRYTFRSFEGCSHRFQRLVSCLSMTILICRNLLQLLCGIWHEESQSNSKFWMDVGLLQALWTLKYMSKSANRGFLKSTALAIKNLAMGGDLIRPQIWRRKGLLQILCAPSLRMAILICRNLLQLLWGIWQREGRVKLCLVNEQGTVGNVAHS